MGHVGEVVCVFVERRLGNQGNGSRARRRGRGWSQQVRCLAKGVRGKRENVGGFLCRDWLSTWLSLSLPGNKAAY